MRDRPNDAHRTIAAVKLGRPLRTDEDVDHVDEDKANNSPTNLQVLPHDEHSRLSTSKRRQSLRKLQNALHMTRDHKKLY